MILPTIFAHAHQSFAILPLALAAIPSVVGAASKWLSGNSQQKKANQLLAGNKRPIYNIPDGITKNAALAEYMAANGKLPGIGTYENRIASGQSRTVGGAIDTQRDPSSIAAVLAASQGNYDNAMEDIATKGAQYQDQNIQRAAAARNTLAGYQDKAWDWNSKQKYLSAMAAASALQHAAGLNKASAYNDVENIGTTLLLNGRTGAGGAGQPVTQGTPYAGVPMRNAGSQSTTPAFDPNNPYGTAPVDPYSMTPPWRKVPYQGAGYNEQVNPNISY